MKLTERMTESLDMTPSPLERRQAPRARTQWTTAPRRPRHCSRGGSTVGASGPNASCAPLSHSASRSRRVAVVAVVIDPTGDARAARRERWLADLGRAPFPRARPRRAQYLLCVWLHRRHRDGSRFVRTAASSVTLPHPRRMLLTRGAATHAPRASTRARRTRYRARARRRARSAR